jgi:hypothetical protein
MALADGDLEMSGGEQSALACGQARLLGRAGEDAALCRCIDG